MPASTRPRYGRLTYTSLHGTGAGGWQIKQQDGDLDAAERELLRARVTTQFDAGVEIPRFPTPEQVRALPRRLVYAPASADAMAWWHTAPAGPDATGRPGNVFAHVVLDRDPDAVDRPPVRPVQLWRSADWLAPYGADQVGRAVLGRDGRPQPGLVITPEAVIDFLLDPVQFRFGVLAALLDATAAALTGGPRVVLITESTDRAALWVGAVSFLMAAPQAARFSFSTLERLPTLGVALDQGVQLACVPAADREQLHGQAADPRSALRRTMPLVVIDESEPVAIGDLGGEPHRTAAGDRITVTEWSVLGQVVLGDEPGAAWALADLDRVAAELDPPTALPAEAVAWPVAMVVGRAGQRFADALAEAAAVVTRTGPAGLAQAPELHRTARELITIGLGRTAADAWRTAGDPAAMQRIGPQTGQLIIEAYVRRAAADPAWLARPGSVPLPRPPRPSGSAADGDTGFGVSVPVERELVTELPGHCAAITEAPGLEQLDRATAVLHLIDLLARSGLDYLDPPEPLLVAFERYCYLLEAGTATGPRLVERVGAVSEQALGWVIRPVLAQQEWVTGRPLGRRLDPVVAGWLFPKAAAPPPLGRLAAGSDDPLRAELAYHRWTSDPKRHADERPLVAWSALRSLQPHQALPAELEHVFDGPPWPTADLLLIRRRWPAAVGIRQWAATVKSAPADEQLARLIDDLRDPLLAGTGPGRQNAAADLIQLRLLSRDQSWLRDRADPGERRNPEDREVVSIISGALWAWDLPGELARDAKHALVCALVLDAVRELGLPGAKRLRGMINSGRGFELQLDTAILIKDCFTIDRKERWLRAALLADQGFALGGVDRAAQQWVGSLTSGGRSLLNSLVQDWAANQIGNRWEQARRITAENLARRLSRLEIDQRAIARQADARLRAIARGR